MMTLLPTGGQMISPLRQAEIFERVQGCLLGQLAGELHHPEMRRKPSK